MCLYYSDTVYLYNGAHDTVDTMYTMMLTTLCYWFIGYTHWTFYKKQHIWSFINISHHLFLYIGYTFDLHTSTCSNGCEKASRSKCC